MALSESEIELCAKWVSAPNHKWQTLNRAQWRYIFHEKTLVRYVDVAKMDEGIVPLLLEYLTAEDGSGGYLCSSTLQLYGQDVSATWTPVRAWYEITNKAAGSVAGVRLYHALTSEPEEQEDGPYLVEDGCAYKVSLTYYWKVAELPTVPASTSGVSYRLSFQRDPDNGLYTATIEKRERVQQDIPFYLHAETIYEKHETEQHLGVKQADVATTGLAAGVANGVLTQRTLSKNSDCTTDVSNAVETEKPVSNAVVERSKRLHAVTRSTTDRNQPTAITDTAGTLKVGETVRSQKTPGGLYDNTHTQVDDEEVGVIGEDCAKTIFEHDHKTHSNVAEKPNPAEATAAGGGHTYAKSSRQTEYGTWDVTESDSQEQAVSNAVKEYRKTLHGTVESTTDKNQGSPLSGSGLKVGESRQSRKTPGGLFDNTTSKVESEAAGEVGAECFKTIFEHRHQTTTNQLDKPSAEVDEAGGGVVKRRLARETEQGTWDVTESVSTEKPIVDAVVERRMTLHGLSESVTNRNQPSPLPAPNQIGHSVVNRKTEGGLYDTVETVEGKEPAGKVRETDSTDYFTHDNLTTVNEQNPQSIGTTFTVGKVEEKISSLNSNGTADNTTKVSTATSRIETRTWSDASGDHEYCTYRNQSAPITPSSASDDVTISASFSMNQYGLFDGHYTKTHKNGGSSSGGGPANFTWTDDITDEMIVYSRRLGYKSKIEYYRERKTKKVTRYNENNGWRIEAIQDVNAHPGVGIYVSKINGAHTWVYYLDDGGDGGWGPIKKRYIM